MLHLPVELVLATLAYLPLGSLRTLQLVSRQWKALIDANKQIVWHQAAALHGFIPSSTVSLSELSSMYSERSMVGVDGWKSFCCRRLQIGQGWSGLGSSGVTEHQATGTDVHRFKIDEKAGYIISTLREGGLVVSDLTHHQVLWSLSEEYVRGYAHCEYGEGYIIFDRSGGAKEVWRRACDYDAAQEKPAVSLPDESQQDASSEATEVHGSTSRGHFKPWLLLQMPEPTRAYRFVFPTLLVTGRGRAFLWNIPTGQLIQTINDIQTTDGFAALRTIKYVELSDRHVFICSAAMLQIFSRADGRRVLNIPATQTSCANWKYSLLPAVSSDAIQGSTLLPHNTQSQYTADEEDRRVIDLFNAVHVSACGSNLVVLVGSSKVIVIFDFERIVRGEAKLREVSMDIQLGSRRCPSIYLAFEHGRIAIATKGGIFVLQPIHENLPAGSPPGLVACRAPWFGDSRSLSCISCLQMTDTGLFLNWSLDAVLDMEEADTIFNESLAAGEYLAGLPNGDQIVLLDPLLDDIPNMSTVYSIDFVTPSLNYMPRDVQFDVEPDSD